ncbi:Glycosyl transferase, family 1 [Klenkia terrae]|nr:Glycosyl transferase, family 1 [Klenkia terrae]
MTLRVAIIHPWFPQYRAGLFHRMKLDAKAKGIELDIFHGPPPKEWQDRNDSIVNDDASQLPTLSFRVGRTSITSKALGPLTRRGPYDLIVAEQAIRHLELYRLLLRPHRTRLGLWGHGRTYTADIPQLQERLKTRITNACGWFFGYTPNGVTSVVEAGFDPDRTTTLFNTIDTDRLRIDLRQVTTDDKTNYRRRYGTQPILFLGALDESKKVPLLIESFKTAAKTNPALSLVVAGEGPLLSYVLDQSSQATGVHYAGSLSGKDKAIALATSSALAVPGRVGLVAVDALVAGIPLATVQSAYHAPEFEYLRPDVDVFIGSATGSDYAQVLTQIAQRERRDQAEPESPVLPLLTVAGMSDRFIKGLIGWAYSEDITQK